MPDILHLYCLDFSNGKKYIGITNAPKRRFVEHRTPKSNCTYVRRAIKKHGCPRLSVLCTGPRNYILDLEIKAIEAFKTQDSRFGYNISAGGESSPALVKEVAEKIRATLTGRKRPPEFCAKMSAAQLGRKRGPRSPEVRANMSAAQKGRTLGPLSPEHRANISAGNKGKAKSPEAVANMSAAQRKRKRSPLSPEHRANIGASSKGRKMSPEARAKMRAARIAYHATIKNSGVQFI